MRNFALSPTAALLAGWCAVLAVAPRATAQDGAAGTAPTRVVSNEVSISGTDARLRLELEDGRVLTMELAGGRVRLNGDDVGGYTAGDALDTSWRALLRAAIDSPPDELPVLFSLWRAPAGSAGRPLAEALASAFANTGNTAAPDQAAQLEPGAVDSIARLQARIQALERMLRELEAQTESVTARARVQGNGRVDLANSRVRELNSWWRRTMLYVERGFEGLFATLMVYAVLLGIGCVLVFFGRKYMEGVADTVRRAPVRSGLVGAAALFLFVPTFAVVTVALAVSVIGIPLLLVWVPLFPLAVALALVYGYLSVAHAAGEALAERRLHGIDWFKANSYYFLATGLVLLLGAFAVAFVARMGGPSLNFIFVSLVTIGTAVTGVVAALGFGAVVLSWAGVRPIRRPFDPDIELPLEESPGA